MTTIQEGQSTYLNDINKGLPVGTSSTYTQVPAINSTPVPKTPDAGSIQGATLLQVPEGAVPTALNNLDSYVGSAMTPSSTSVVDAKTGMATTPETGTSASKGITAKLSALYDKLTGKSEFQANVEDDIQVNSKQQASVDASNQFNRRSLEMNKQEQDFINTNTGLTSKQKDFQLAEMRRNNSYERANLAITAQAAQGNYTAALDTVKRKVDAVYEPMQKQIENLEKFYTLNQNDLSESEKMDQQTKIDELKAEKKAKSDAYADVMKRLLDNNAPASAYTEVDKVAKDPKADVSSIYASAGEFGSNADTTITDVGGRKVIVNSRTGEVVKDLGASNSGFLDPKEKVVMESNLRKEFTGLPVVKDSNSVRGSYNGVQSAYDMAIAAGKDKTSKAAADQALVVGFNKLIDPGSVVREGEFARSTQGQSVINRLKGKAEAVASGGVGLTDQDRKDIVDMTKVLYADYVRLRNAETLRYRGLAEQQGLSPKNVAEFLPTEGIIDVQSAREGDILILDGKPYSKQGNEFIELGVSDELGFNGVGGDTNAASIAAAIRSVESNGNYNAVGDSGTSKGAYQFQPGTWKDWAGEFLGNPNAPMTKENQDKVALAKIDSLLKQGYNAEQIALIWNGGEPKAKKGYNKKLKVAYDSGAYAKKVLQALKS